ncbi:type II toxin-antitoxin system VapC family toxin [Actinopolymorpha sp. B11F2]|uniref:type II toxin-antitoxin system VapC family toxin n=1 Tax=Actinopolymorpha sp. B11F2 TaxID=3160862 RepID=UPI0032E49FE4
MIYLDTAALIKLIRPEQESNALVDWLEQRRPEPLVASALVEVEVPRALRRSEPELLSAAPAVLSRIALYDLDDLVRATAAAYQDPALRSLDTIHLATASAVFGDELTAFVTYDKWLLAAAKSIGLPIAHPGA